ncbi:MAG: methylenetetrahydrofolate reductase [NAD(P)H] [Verrucomicrobia bacterium]|nr:methylenetetrahydrofolate reductase [NAD(P)H] [Verrucomicrobiota bacterium]
MRFIRDIYAECRAAGRPAISYEFFTPKTPEGDRALREKTVPALCQFKPDYCSVTYGAGGSTREKTFSMVDALQRQHGVTTMAHLTCVGSTRPQIEEIVAQARALGIKNLLALRGDPPDGSSEFKKVEGGFEFAFQLVELIRRMGGFSIGVAGFPEGHVACKEGAIVDWKRLKAKIDGGADFVVTQLFFDNRDFFEFRDYLTARLGVTVPIVPGILPILSGKQVRKFTQLCGSRLPISLLVQLDDLGDDDAAATEFGIDYAAKQCEELLRQGVPGLHFYTLNKAHSTLRILDRLGLKSA